MPHLHDKIDFTVEVYVVRDGRVLLRKHDKYKIWLSVGGHIELDEDPVQAAVREVKEEVGLDIRLLGDVPKTREAAPEYRELLAPRFLNRHRASETHEHVTLVYFALLDSGEIRQSDQERSTDIRWFTDAELDDPAFGVLPDIRHYAHAALAAAGHAAL